MRLFWDSYRNQFLMISTKSRQEVVRDLSRRDHCNSLKQYLKHLEMANQILRAISDFSLARLARLNP